MGDEGGGSEGDGSGGKGEGSGGWGPPCPPPQKLTIPNNVFIRCRLRYDRIVV